MMKENLIKIYERSFIDNWELPALTDYNTGERMTYGDFARNIARLHMLFDGCGVKAGDRIALIGKNIPNWLTAFMATITYGAVIVPILQEFNPADAQHIINHSEATMLFISKSIWENLEFDKMPRVRAVFQIEDMSLVAEKEGDNVATQAMTGLDSAFAAKYSQGFYRNDIEAALADVTAYAQRLIDDEEFRAEEVADTERWVAGKPKELISEYKMFGD